METDNTAWPFLTHKQSRRSSCSRKGWKRAPHHGFGTPEIKILAAFQHLITRGNPTKSVGAPVLRKLDFHTLWKRDINETEMESSNGQFYIEHSRHTLSLPPRLAAGRTASYKEWFCQDSTLHAFARYTLSSKIIGANSTMGVTECFKATPGLISKSVFFTIDIRKKVFA